MKTLKITLALVAVLFLTVSGVQPDANIVSENKEVKQSTKIDLLAHNKLKVRIPPNG